MYAREVHSQLELDPMSDLNSLPMGLAALYMQRYEKTFPEEIVGNFEQYNIHTKPMLEILVASKDAMPVEISDNPRHGFQQRLDDLLQFYNGHASSPEVTPSDQFYATGPNQKLHPYVSRP